MQWKAVLARVVVADVRSPPSSKQSACLGRRWWPHTVWSLSLAAVLFAAEASALDLAVPLFMSASDNNKQGFVRIINHSNAAGKASVTPIDDSGREYPTFSLDLLARSTLHFNSSDLELGNAEKGIPNGTGPGTGDWRLEIYIDDDDGLDVEVLAYVRTLDGFVASMHDLVPGKTRHRVPTFNPASNTNQVSLLRLINSAKTSTDVTIVGLDDAWKVSSTVTLALRPGEAQVFTAQELELGTHERLSGSLGDGNGKWQLFISSSQEIRVMSLIQSMTGHLTNLSSQTSDEEYDLPLPQQ